MGSKAQQRQKQARPAKAIEQYSSDEDSSEESDAGSLHAGGSDGGDSDDDDGEEDEDEEERRAALRKQLEDVPFDQRIRVRDRIEAGRARARAGPEARARAKEARRALRERLGAGDDDGSGGSDGSDGESGPEEAPAKRGDMQRASTKMPAVMSSKRPVGRLRQVVEMPRGRGRDPRFDSLSGALNEDLFEKSYGFLAEQRQQEMAELRTQARQLRDKNPAEAARVRRALETMQSQAAAREQKQRVQELKRKHRKMEAEAVRQGKRPYFLGRRELKELEAAQKFGSLSPAKVDRFLEKRRKRNAAKDHRRMPYQRREEGGGGDDDH
ncbi:rRNA biogenesis protein rrp36 [Coemansia javaensis]|uniref:rRNA biogenesis protein RRP36 n=1 Tax=Coemansia javaensis TaxID=2761396 RepID=A0A9W8HAM0_9FUNG|nr:rRNA biogenesis protein rrp36 [Coemansia javaensis]